MSQLSYPFHRSRLYDKGLAASCAEWAERVYDIGNKKRYTNKQVLWKTIEIRFLFRCENDAATFHRRNAWWNSG